MQRPVDVDHGFLLRQAQPLCADDAHCFAADVLYVVEVGGWAELCFNNHTIKRHNQALYDSQSGHAGHILLLVITR